MSVQSVQGGFSVEHDRVGDEPAQRGGQVPGGLGEMGQLGDRQPLVGVRLG